MAVIPEQCAKLVSEFIDLYPASAQVSFNISPTIEDLYGDQARNEHYKGARGGYSPATAGGSRPRCDFYTANIRDENELLGILRHELLGHFGINTLPQSDKQAVLTGIIQSQGHPSMAPLWAMVNKLYSSSSLLIRAEEVFAFASEALMAPGLQNLQAGQRAIDACCKHQIRPLAWTDLQSISIMVANNMRNPGLQIQVLPQAKHQQFNKDNVTCDGVHAGKVVSVTDGWVEQRVNRDGATVNHIAQLLNAKLRVGDVVEIRYNEGRGVVRGHDKGASLGR